MSDGLDTFLSRAELRNLDAPNLGTVALPPQGDGVRFAGGHCSLRDQQAREWDLFV